MGLQTYTASSWFGTRIYAYNEMPNVILFFQNTITFCFFKFATLLSTDFNLIIADDWFCEHCAAIANFFFERRPRAITKTTTSIVDQKSSPHPDDPMKKHNNRRQRSQFDGGKAPFIIFGTTELFESATWATARGLLFVVRAKIVQKAVNRLSDQHQWHLVTRGNPQTGNYHQERTKQKSIDESLLTYSNLYEFTFNSQMKLHSFFGPFYFRNFRIFHLEFVYANTCKH